ncbi:hypothetical protein AB5N79_16650 [Xanthomonas citri pv. citri]
MGKQVAAATFGNLTPRRCLAGRAVAIAESTARRTARQRSWRLSSTRHPARAGWAHFSGPVMSVVYFVRSLPLFLQWQAWHHRDVRPRGTRTLGARSINAPRYVGQLGRGVVLALSATF